MLFHFWHDIMFTNYVGDPFKRSFLGFYGEPVYKRCFVSHFDKSPAYTNCMNNNKADLEPWHLYLHIKNPVCHDTDNKLASCHKHTYFFINPTLNWFWQNNGKLCRGQAEPPLGVPLTLSKALVQLISVAGLNLFCMAAKCCHIMDNGYNG